MTVGTKAPVEDQRSPTPRPWRRAAPWAVVAAGAAGLVLQLIASTVSTALPIAVRALLLAVATAALIAGAGHHALGHVSSVPLREAMRRAVLEGVPRLWPSAAPLALLPLAARLPAGWAAAACVALSCLSVVLASLPLASQPPSRSAEPDGARRLGPWELSLLVLCLCIAVFYVLHGARMPGNGDNDSAYHFGVARHIVRAGRFQEPIVWHFLGAPESLIHRPFDYWGGLTAVLLVPALAAFGTTFKVAFVTMAVISALSVLAFWYLAAVVLRLRPPVQLLAILLFAFSPWMAGARFDTESIPVFHLGLLLSLIAIGERRVALAACAAFSLVLCRAEGVVLCAALWAACVGCAARRPAGPGGGALRVLVTISALAATYVTWSLVSFGSPLPPGVSAATRLRHYNDLFAYGAELDAPWASIGSRLDRGYLADRVSAAVAALRRVSLVPAQDLWLAFGLLGGLPWLRRRPAVESIVWALFFGGALLLVWASPPQIFRGERSLGTLLPLAVLAGAAGLSDLLARAARWARRGWQAPRAGWSWAGVARGARCAAPGLAILAVFWVTVPSAPVYAAWSGAKPPVESELRRLNRFLEGQPVASTLPWQVVSNTDSPAISVPENGEAAIDAALRRYKIRWLVLTASHHRWMRESRALLDEIASGTRSSVGGLRLERVARTGSVLVLRVTDEGGSPL